MDIGHTIHTPSWTGRLQSIFGEFTDLFSEFSRYVAPIYRHDRCERSVQMKLYTLNKCQFVIVFVVFFICYGVTLLVGTAGPAVTHVSQQNVSTLSPQPANYASGPFVIQSPAVGSFHQQLWLTAQIVTAKIEGETFARQFVSSIQVRGLNNLGSGGISMFDGAYHNSSQVLTCSQSCDSVSLLHLSYLEYSAYIITVQFYGLENNKYPINDIIFSFHTYNKDFTKLQVWSRFFFLLMTFIATCAFAHSLRRFYVRDWSMEQKWMAVLLPLLLFYDNPLYPLTFLINSWVPNLLDSIFQATFLSMLLVYWLCIYHGMRQTKRLFVTFYLPKVFIVGLMWSAAIALSAWHIHQELDDPTYANKQDSSNLLGVRIFFLVVGCLYMLYLFYLLIRSCAELRSMPYFDLRLKFMTTFMLLVLGVSITIMIMRFGVNALHDGITKEISVPYGSALQFLAMYSLLNYYVFVMAFVYSPSRNAASESHFKDNPTISMLNDSDEEIFGAEESVSLNKNKPKTRPLNDDD